MRKGWQARTTPSVARRKADYSVAGMRKKRRRTKERRGKETTGAAEGGVTKKDARENATREDPEESGGTFPPPLSVTHFSHPAREHLVPAPRVPSPRLSRRGETRCIIHDFVNVACRCIFTALYLEKFRPGETRYR